MLQATASTFPFVIVSATIGEEAAVEAMKAGAHDYILKHRLGRLVPAVSRELRESAVRTRAAQSGRAVAARAEAGEPRAAGRRRGARFQ